ncbi:MAG: acyltransferase family protein [Bacteroidaceae bacterium]|nr:acyltransferase family protein [Bacteroidaceae bacterium]
MTKEESLQLKGIAIMMMLWLHLFGTDKAILAETTKILYINDSEPFIYAMRKFGRMCVVFYTFLGGYGLAKVYQRNATVKGLGIVTGMKNGKRVWNLFKSYWLVMTIFILIATLLQPGKYPGNIMEVALNITALDITYNDTLWFLFPYALLTLFAQPIIKLSTVLRGTWLWMFITFAFIVKTIAYNTKIPFDNLEGIVIRNIFSATELFFMFFVGALFARNSLMERCVTSVKERISHSRITCCLHIGTSTVCTAILLLLFTGRIFMGASTLIDPFYIIPMIIIYLCIERPKWLNSGLEYIGSHSTNIWFTHRYLLVLSGTAIAFFQHSVIIFAVLVIICLTISHIINMTRKAIHI